MLDNVDALKLWLIAFGLATAYAASHLFNQYVDRAWETDPLNSDAGAWVAIGVTYTLADALFVLSILYGWQHAAVAVGVIFVCFIASGSPMLFGEMARGRKRRMAAQRQELPAVYAEEFVED